MGCVRAGALAVDAGAAPGSCPWACPPGRVGCPPTEQDWGVHPLGVDTQGGEGSADTQAAGGGHSWSLSQGQRRQHRDGGHSRRRRELPPGCRRRKLGQAEPAPPVAEFDGSIVKTREQRTRQRQCVWRNGSPRQRRVRAGSPRHRRCNAFHGAQYTAGEHAVGGGAILRLSLGLSRCLVLGATIVAGAAGTGLPAMSRLVCVNGRAGSTPLSRTSAGSAVPLARRARLPPNVHVLFVVCAFCARKALGLQLLLTHPPGRRLGSPRSEAPAPCC